MKKVLIATTNAGKVNLYKQVLADAGFEGVGAGELGVVVDVEENGLTEIENAIIKAKAFFEACSGMPVLANDSGLIIDKFSENDQPKQLVRRYGGRDLTDEEMIEVYVEKLKKVGGESTGHYNVALAIVDENGKVYSREFKPERYFVSTPSTTLQKGFPLSSLAYDKKTGKYLSEMNAVEKIAYEQEAMIKQRKFIEETLQK